MVSHDDLIFHPFFIGLTKLMYLDLWRVTYNPFTTKNNLYVANLQFLLILFNKDF